MVRVWGDVTHARAGVGPWPSLLSVARRLVMASVNVLPACFGRVMRVMWLDGSPMPPFWKSASGMASMPALCELRWVRILLWSVMGASMAYFFQSGMGEYNSTICMGKSSYGSRACCAAVDRLWSCVGWWTVICVVGAGPTVACEASSATVSCMSGREIVFKIGTYSAALLLNSWMMYLW